MKTMYPPAYHHSGFVVMTGRAHCFYNIYVIYYAHLASVRFEHSVLSWITYYHLYKYINIYIYIYIYNIYMK